MADGASLTQMLGEGEGEGGEKRRWRMILICVFSVFEPKSLKRAESGDTNMQFDM